MDNLFWDIVQCSIQSDGKFVKYSICTKIYCQPFFSGNLTEYQAVFDDKFHSVLLFDNMTTF